MLASVIIEYSVKSLNKVFDYKIPEDLKDLVEKLYHNNVDAMYISKFEDIVKYLKENNY